MTKSGRGRLPMNNVQYVLFMSEFRVDGVEVTQSTRQCYSSFPPLQARGRSVNS